MKISFTKMSGSGNDFVVIDNRSVIIRNGMKTARIMCDRRWGVGADGLLLVEKSRRADYRMMYYNADGSYGGMCGNGGRCIAKFAELNRIAPRSHKFEALDHVYSVSVRGSVATLAMKDPRNLKLNRKIRIDGNWIEVSQVDTGSPHVVVSTRSLAGRKALEKIDVFELGKKIRYHVAFKPKGTNANFIERGGGNSISIRTYERGVEAETLACGTGSVAAAIVASRIWKLKSPIIVVPLSGKPLKVEFSTISETFADVRLTGPVTVSFEGTFELHEPSR
jgi:diaminopimelate epimerase